MKAFLLASAALTIALPVQADSVWLIMKEVVSGKENIGVGMEKLEMRDLNQCEEQGAIWSSSKRAHKTAPDAMGFECIKGK